MQPPPILVRIAVTAFQQMRGIGWFVFRPKVRGVLAVPVTADGKVVLVRLTYARGWHLPGGGLKRDEAPEAAVLRELREEIGLIAHDELRHVATFEHRPDRRRGTSDLFLVRGVRYAPARSIEIEEVAAFDPERLPADIAPLARAKIDETLA